jgi:hypothetical protein
VDFELIHLCFAWSTPAGRVKATYRAEVVSHAASADRYVCRLADLVAVERDAANHAVSDDVLRNLIGKCVRVPREALNGRTLPLKPATLSGGLSRPYFFDE